MLIAGCALCWAAYSLLGKLVLKRLSPLMATTWATFFGLAFLGPAALIEEGPSFSYSPAGWAGLAFLGLLGTALGFTLYYQGILRLGAARAAVFINLVPVFGLLSGWLILDERLGWYLAAGLALVLSGIHLIQKPDTP
jgi:drug/metabolite transporter (DMT)-like permease